MFIKYNYLEEARSGLARELWAELDEHAEWRVQEDDGFCRFAHATDGGVGNMQTIGPACAFFEEWITSGVGFEWLQTYTGKKLRWTNNVSATKWEPGDYLGIHDDSPQEPGWTYTIFLSPRWAVEWGGHLIVEEETGWRLIPSECDRMALFFDRPHLVSQIATYCPRTRYAITGWLTNA